MKPRTALVALVLISVLASGCTAGADMTGNLSAQVKAWTAGSGMGSLVARLSSDGAAMGSAVAANNLNQLKTACATLGRDVSQANS
ncbi:MAG: hypothetical protein ACYCS7_03225, partial [Acidimicrobiales bacterium]